MDEQINVCIQVSAGSCEKKLYNEKTLELLRMSTSPIPYPFAYGFIVDTESTDGDNLDCYVISQEELASGSIVTCEPIALMEQYEDDEQDPKIIATLPGEQVIFGDDQYQRLKNFILTVFAQWPEIRIKVGAVRSRQDAVECIQASRGGDRG